MLGQPRSFGIAGLDLNPGDHVCAIYVGTDERDSVMLPYLRAGLREGDKCIAVIDSAAPTDVAASVGKGSGLGAAAMSEQLELHTTDEAYLRTGPFSTGDMIEYWDERIGAAVRGGYAFARALGEMSWQLRAPPERDEFFRYESELNRFAPRYPQAILCLYDLGRFGGTVVADLMRTHRRLLTGGMFLESPHYLEPDEYLASDPNTAVEEALAAWRNAIRRVDELEPGSRARRRAERVAAYRLQLYESARSRSATEPATGA